MVCHIDFIVIQQGKILCLGNKFTIHFTITFAGETNVYFFSFSCKPLLSDVALVLQDQIIAKPT